MRVLLRVIALTAAIAVLQTVVFLAQFAQVGVSQMFAADPIFGVITMMGWVVTFVAGPVAAVQLFRLRNSGRVAGLLLFGCMLLYYAVGFFAFRLPSARVAPIIVLALFLALVIGLLLSPAAKRACKSGSPVSVRPLGR